MSTENNYNPTVNAHQPGDACPCGWHLQVVNTRIVAHKRRQYLGCRKCGYRPAHNRIENSVLLMRGSQLLRRRYRPTMVTVLDKETNSMLLPIDQVAGRLSVSASTVRKLVNAGRLPRPVEVGGTIRWRESDLEKWEEQLQPAGCEQLG